MLTVPAFNTLENATIYQDDAAFNRFHVVANKPRVRIDENGDPVFLLIKYAFSDEDAANDPNLPAGGGFLAFDVDLTVPDTELESIREELQSWVDTEYLRLKSGDAEERALVASMSEAPPVDFGVPTFTDGAVQMSTTQAAALVSNSVAAGAPSLLSGNIAIFNVDLTAAGATFMQKTLVGEEGVDTGEDVVDLTPVQVRYDLSFWARLPPAEIRVSVDAEKIHDQVRKVIEDAEEPRQRFIFFHAGYGARTLIDFTMPGRKRTRRVPQTQSPEFDESDTDTSTISLDGLIEVHVDNGSGSLDSDELAELREYAIELVTSMLENSFFEDSAESLDLEETDESDQNRFRKIYDKSTMNLDLILTQSSVIEWSVHPQATLQTFFSEMDPSQLERFVRVVDLDDDFFKKLGLRSRAIYNEWDRDLVASVVVDVDYRAKDENGNEVEKGETFVFTKDEHAEKEWNPSLIADERDYRYRTQVSFSGRGEGPWSPWQKEDTRQLLVHLVNPGEVHVDVVAGNVDWDKLVRQIQVVVAYEDDEQGVSREEETITLTKAHPEKSYERVVYAPVTQAVQYRVRTVLQDDSVLEEPAGGAWMEAAGRQIFVNQPFVNSLEVAVMAAGPGWPMVALVLVGLRFSPPGGEVIDEQVELTALGDMRMWKVRREDSDQNAYQWKLTVIYKDGTSKETAWADAEGPQLHVSVPGPPRVWVELLPALLRFDELDLVTVNMRYTGGGLDVSDLIEFTDTTKGEWIVDLPSEGLPNEYSYSVTYYPKGGDAVVMAPVTADTTKLVIPRYSPPAGPVTGPLNVEVVGFVVDWAATPYVVVSLQYDDEANDVHHNGSVDMDARGKKTWTVEVADTTYTRVGWKVTYYTAAGDPHESELKFTEDGRIVIPRFVPPAE